MLDKPIKTILLIDDDDATNFLNKIIIRRSDCAGHVHVSTNGKRALEYLTEAINGQHPFPDLILLDINMPVMDGWTFLQEYDLLPGDMRAKIILVMLTASVNPDDEARASHFPEVKCFKTKLLTEEILSGIVETYFV